MSIKVSVFSGSHYDLLSRYNIASATDLENVIARSNYTL